jgi:hypothetical protein
MQQTKEELLRLACKCLGQAALLLDAAGEDLLTIRNDGRGAARKRIRGPVRARRQTSLPPAANLISAGNVGGVCFSRIDSPWRR